MSSHPNNASNLFKESIFTKNKEFGAGLFNVNISTLEQFEAMCIQSRETSNETHLLNIKNNILTNSYKLCYPLVLSHDSVIVDGYTRSKALIAIINSNPTKEYIVSYIVSESGVDEFNNSRGLCHKDISNNLKNIKNKYPLVQTTGKLNRAVDQFIEARKILLITNNKREVSYSQAFDEITDQEIYVAIMDIMNEYEESFAECAIIAQDLGLSLNDIKFSHWIAFFIRVKHDQINRNIAKDFVIKSSGGANPNREDRVNCFNQMIDISNERHA
ncbi:hypothetical protein GLP21_19500 [Photobacterium carnosum]|uniref:hypothetical protein n=1 Tax=Photobacterium carnosum TaxID=2023717 RepID=UPI001E59D15D|nr:hypothetical protein [Photobacterium carnosum]MCD9550804.1 hypothetical protein [Photobacterium carnosum]MCF2304683.1 hypothetical protein [Photobacterium carnosum]